MGKRSEAFFSKTVLYSLYSMGNLVFVFFISVSWASPCDIDVLALTQTLSCSSSSRMSFFSR